MVKSCLGALPQLRHINLLYDQLPAAIESIDLSSYALSSSINPDRSGVPSDCRYLFVLLCCALDFGSKYQHSELRSRSGSLTKTIQYKLAPLFKGMREKDICEKLYEINACDFAGLFIEKEALYKDDSNGLRLIELMEDRKKALNEVINFLHQFEYKTLNLIEATNFDCLRLASLLSSVSNFSDVDQYQGKTIFFFKKAQLTSAMLAAAGAPIGGREYLSGLADNGVPATLLNLKVMMVDDRTEREINERRLLPVGGGVGTEIRIATICAVDALTKLANKRNLTLCSLDIDKALWNLAPRPSRPTSAVMRPIIDTRWFF